MGNFGGCATVAFSGQYDRERRIYFGGSCEELTSHRLIFVLCRKFSVYCIKGRIVILLWRLYQRYSEQLWASKLLTKPHAASKFTQEYPKEVSLDPYSTYYTHLTCRQPGTQRWAHSRMTQLYLRPMLTPRQPHATSRNTSTP